MIIESVESSNLSKVAYDKIGSNLVVQFKNGGIYSYVDVPEDVFGAFKGADSQGSFLARKIKPQFEVEKIDHDSFEKACLDITIKSFVLYANHKGIYEFFVTENDGKLACKVDKDLYEKNATDEEKEGNKLNFDFATDILNTLLTLHRERLNE